MTDNQHQPFSIQSEFAKIAILIESSKGSAALAEQMLWNIVQLHPESIPDGCRDLTLVAGKLTETGFQFCSHLEIVQSFVRSTE